MLGKRNKTEIKAIKSRGRKRRPAPKASQTSDGKPPGLQSVKRTGN